MHEKSAATQLDMFTRNTYTYRSVLTNGHTSTEKEIIEYYNAIVADKFDDINPTTRSKRFVFRFITVAGRWVY
ncbi:MAG: hypothetical protein GY834_11835 [Bacteroidetes bacterium]|nr:hypothetical protein [Bacteroidota bacterium]